MYGTHLLSTTEELQPISIEEIYKKIKTPNDDVLNTITRLRTLRTISKTRYVQMKKELPFFVCSIFSPKFRRTENFAYTEYFVVDIDNLSEKKLEPEDIKQTLIKDKRVNMCFTSPSCDGIKLLFKLNDRCYDAGIYAMFYRSFIHQLSEQYNLDQVVDTKTCDVTRACFLSHDPSAYLQNDPKYIKISDYLNLDNINDMFTQDHILIDATKKEKQEISQSKSEEILDPDKETLLHIKGILGQKKALMMQKKPPVYIPTRWRN